MHNTMASDLRNSFEALLEKQGYYLSTWHIRLGSLSAVSFIVSVSLFLYLYYRSSFEVQFLRSLSRTVRFCACVLILSVIPLLLFTTQTNPTAVARVTTTSPLQSSPRQPFSSPHALHSVVPSINPAPVSTNESATQEGSGDRRRGGDMTGVSHDHDRQVPDGERGESYDLLEIGRTTVGYLLDFPSRLRILIGAPGKGESILENYSRATATVVVAMCGLFVDEHVLLRWMVAIGGLMLFQMDSEVIVSQAQRSPHIGQETKERECWGE
eukprot:GHVQ01021084.1.p1 GENE.GHVQ01021084.1~~GHVQ01021084.1.p1  ORF type:complete len:269 (+),score=35.37 GHVQ01021084.1:218-1024(+)